MSQNVPFTMLHKRAINSIHNVDGNVEKSIFSTTSSKGNLLSDIITTLYLKNS